MHFVLELRISWGIVNGSKTNVGLTPLSQENGLLQKSLYGPIFNNYIQSSPIPDQTSPLVYVFLGAMAITGLVGAISRLNRRSNTAADVKSNANTEPSSMPNAEYTPGDPANIQFSEDGSPRRLNNESIFCMRYNVKPIRNRPRCNEFRQKI